MGPLELNCFCYLFQYNLCSLIQSVRSTFDAMVHQDGVLPRSIPCKILKWPDYAYHHSHKTRRCDLANFSILLLIIVFPSP